MRMPRPVIGDWSDAASRVLVGGLFFAFAWRLLDDFMATNRTTDLLMVIGEALVVILTCLRRPATVVDRRAIVRLVTTVSMMSPLLMIPGKGAPLVPESQAALLVAIGLVVVVAGKISLGRSFGLLPANRGVMEHGLYRVVRHPIYLGYLITHVPFLAAHPSAWNLTVLAVGDTALIIRAFYEEQTLVRDPQYARYCKTVKWRLVPGLC
jgi:protein-S-isoprenylcysteine O-methyltransferase Ste14